MRRTSSFPQEQRNAMLNLKGVGSTVVDRLEEIGFSELSQLQDVEPADLVQRIAAAVGSTCWRNSPQAKQAMQKIVSLAAAWPPKQA